MNIKKRLEKLEKQQTSGGGFCLCSGSATRFEILVENFPSIDAKPLPNVCDICGLSVNKQTIIIQGVESTINAPELAKL